MNDFEVKLIAALATGLGTFIGILLANGTIGILLNKL